MKLANMILATIAVATGVNAFAKDKPKESNNAARQVTVYFRDNNVVELSVEASAKAQASKMFADIGVSLKWRSGHPAAPEAGDIVVEAVNDAPATFKPGALAYAFPYEGVHIRIFADRINACANRREILAHVMVHEITHILQGEARHSSQGIMKAIWSPADFTAMAMKPLAFASEDVELIYRGMDNRAAQAASRSSAPAEQAATTAAVGIGER